MEKVKIELDILLPGISDERDNCVERIISTLQTRKGIEKVHVVHEGNQHKAHLCFHYNPEIISIENVQQLARKAGAELTEQFGHLLLDVDGIRHIRHARYIEAELSKIKGILDVSVSGGGLISAEFDLAATNREAIVQAIEKMGLRIKQVPEPHRHTEEDKEHPHTHEHVGAPHTHEHGGFFGKNTELIFSLICGALLGIGFGLSFISGPCNRHR